MKRDVASLWRLLAALGLGMLCLASAPAARADFIAYVIPAGQAGNQAHTGGLGMDFDVGAAAIAVSQLGVFDDGSNGLSLPLTAYLWDRTNTAAPLATLTFTGGDPGTLVGGSRFKPLAVPLNLPAGFQGRMSADGYGGGEQNGNNGTPPWTTDTGGGLISFVGMSYWHANPGVYPTNADGGPVNRYAAGTFQFALPGPTGILVWDSSPNNWGAAPTHWTGGPPDYPTATIGARVNAGLVTVEASHTANTLEVNGGEVAIGAGNTLTVPVEVKVASGATLSFGAGARLTAAKGSIDLMKTGGNATLDASGTLSVTTFNDQGIAGTLTKLGAGTVALDNTSGTGVLAGKTTFDVQAGTLKGTGLYPFGTPASSQAPPQIILSGGTLEVDGVVGDVTGIRTLLYKNRDTANGGLFPRGGTFGGNGLLGFDSYAGITALMAGLGTVDNSVLLNAGNDSYPASAGRPKGSIDFPPGLGANGPDQDMFTNLGVAGYQNNLFAFWQAKFTVGAADAGLTSFRTVSDDGTVVYIDGNKVVDNNQFQGVTWRGGTYNLTAGVHDVLVGYYEGGGGNSLQAVWTPLSTGSEIFINGSDPRFTTTGFGAVDMTATPILVTANSAIKAVTDMTASFGTVTLTNGTALATSGGATVFGQVLITGGSGRTGTLSPANSLTVTTLNDGGVPDNLIMAGTGNLVLPSVTAVAGTTFRVNSGTLTGVDTSQLGNAGTLLLGGGTYEALSTTGSAALSLAPTNVQTLASTSSAIKATTSSTATFNNLTLGANSTLTLSGGKVLFPTTSFGAGSTLLSGANGASLGATTTNGNANIGGAGQVVPSTYNDQGVANSTMRIYGGVTLRLDNTGGSKVFANSTVFRVEAGATLDAAGADPLGTGNTYVALAGGTFRATPPGNATLSLPGARLSVLANSTFQANTTGGAVVNALTFDAPGILTTTSNGGDIRFTSTTVNTGGTVGIDSAARNFVGPVTVTGNPPFTNTFAKLGSGDLVLDAPGTGLQNTTFDARGGRLITVGPAPVSGAKLNIGGGELVLASPDGKDVTYPNLVTSTANGTLTAGRGGVAPMGRQVILPNLLPTEGSIIKMNDEMSCFVLPNGISRAGLVPTPNALGHKGYNIPPEAPLDLNNNGGMMAMQPFGTTRLTDGPGGRGLYFQNDTDFINTGAVGQADNYTNLFIGMFKAPVTGSYGFEIRGVDDRAGVWLDLNQNGIFESAGGSLGSESGERLRGWDQQWNTKTVSLVGGQSYMFAATHGEWGGGSSVEILFRTPSMSGLADVKPADPAQAGLWSTLTPKAGGLDIFKGQTITLGALDLGSLTLSGGDLIRNGTSPSTSGSRDIKVSDFLTLSGGKNLAMTQGAKLTTTGATVNINAGSTLWVDQPVNAANLNIQGNLVRLPGGSGMDVTATSSLTLNSTLDMRAGGALNTAGANVTITSAGNLTATAPIQAATLSSAGTLTMPGANVTNLIIGGGTTTTTGNVTVAKGLNGGGGTFVTRGDLTVDAQGSLGLGGTIRVESGHATINVPSGGAMPGSVQLLLDAANITGLNNGDTVAQWLDTSGQNHNTTGISGTPKYQGGALNGNAVVRFDGNAGFNLGNLGSSFPSAATLFVVTTLTSESGYNLFTTRNNDSWWRYDGNGNSYPGPFRNGRAGDYSTGMPTTGSHVFEVDSSSAAWEMFIDGVNPRGSAFGGDYLGGDDYRIAFDANGAGRSLTGDIAAIIAFNSVLSPAERNAVGGYLASRFGIATTYAGGLSASLGDIRLAPSTELTLAGAGNAQVSSVGAIGGPTVTGPMILNTGANLLANATADTVTFDATVNSGGFSVTGPGTIALKQNVTLTGALSVPAGAVLSALNPLVLDASGATAITYNGGLNVAGASLTLKTPAALATFGNLTMPNPGSLLTLTGSAQAAFNSITAANGATIVGSVTAKGPVAPGSSPGTLNVTGAFAMGAGSTYQWETLGNAPGQSDLIAVTGNLDLTGPWTLAITPLKAVPGGTYDLFTYTGSDPSTASATKARGASPYADLVNLAGSSLTSGGGKVSLSLAMNSSTQWTSNSGSGGTIAWNVAPNWDSGVPNASTAAIVQAPAANQVATVSGPGAAAQTLIIDNGGQVLVQSAGALQVTNNAYVEPTGSLTVNGTFGAAQLNTAGTTTFGPVAILSVPKINVTGGTTTGLGTPLGPTTTLTLTGGLLAGSFESTNPSTTPGSYAFEIQGGTATAALRGNTASLRRSGGGTATLGGPVTLNTMSVEGGTTTIADSETLKLNALSVTGGSLAINRPAKLGDVTLATGTMTTITRDAVVTKSLTGGGTLVTGGGLTLDASSALVSLTGELRVTGGNLLFNVPAGVAAPAGAVAYYSFDNVSGNTIINDGSLGASKNGTLLNGAGLTPGGKVGQAMTIVDGSSNRLDVPGVPLGAEWTISAWYKDLHGTDNWRTLTRAGGGDADHEIMVETGTNRLGMYNNSGTGPGGFQQAGTSTLLPNDGWHHIVAVGPAASNTEDFYVDGVYVGTTPLNTKGTSPINWIGNGDTGWGQSWSNVLDEVYIYNRALKTSEISALYAAGAGGTAQLGDLRLGAGSQITLGGEKKAIFKSIGAIGGVTITSGLTLAGANPNVRSENAQSLTVNGALTTSNFQITGPGTVTLTDKLTVPAGGTISVPKGATLASQGSNVLIDAPSASFVMGGKLNVASGTLTINLPAATGSFPSGLVLRLDGSNITGVGNLGKVNSWPDSSGQSHPADQATGNPLYVASGLNGQPVVRFVATDGADYLKTSYDFDGIGNQYTILTVERYTGGRNERVVSSVNHNWLFGVHGGLEDRWHAEGWIYPPGGNGGTPATTNWNIYAGTIDSANVANFWRNGTQLAINAGGANAGNHNPGRLQLGGTDPYPGEASNAEVAQVLIFNRVLTSTELNNVGGYLSSRYGLTTGFSGSLGATNLGDLQMAPATHLVLGGPSGPGTGGASFTSIASGPGAVIHGNVTATGLLDPTGTLTVKGNLDLAPSAVYKYDLGMSPADLIAPDSLTIDKTFTLQLFGTGASVGHDDWLKIFDFNPHTGLTIGTALWDGSDISLNLAALITIGNLEDPFHQYVWDTCDAALVHDDQGIYLTGLVAELIPEPATLTLLALGGLALLRRRRARGHARA